MASLRFHGRVDGGRSRAGAETLYHRAMPRRCADRRAVRRITKGGDRVSEIAFAFLAGNALRMVLFAIYLVAAILSMLRRRTLGDVAVFGMLGFGALAAASAVSLGLTYWQLTALQGDMPRA